LPFKFAEFRAGISSTFQFSAFASKKVQLPAHGFDCPRSHHTSHFWQGGETLHCPLAADGVNDYAYGSLPAPKIRDAPAGRKPAASHRTNCHQSGELIATNVGLIRYNDIQCSVGMARREG